MTPNHPPRLALWLLERFGPHNEPLSGDLVEGFELTGSRLWFWRQVLAAVLFGRFDRSREIRPLRLVERASFETVQKPAVAWRSINLTASPIHGIGGLGLLALAIAISAVGAQLWWIALTVLLLVTLTGLLLGLAFIVLHRPGPPQVTRTLLHPDAP
jgi:hypothetical protein